jgi:DNA polymerase-1
VIAPPGYKLIVADYSAQELRILADLSGDTNMLDLFEREADPHIYTASLMFGIPTEEVDKAKRGVAKTINYLITYGGSAFLLASRLKVSTNEAEELMSKWFEAYPQVKPWLDKRARHTQDKCNSPTATGWVRQFPKAKAAPTKPKRYSDGGYDDGAWEKYHEEEREYKQSLNRLARQGMNTPIQGCAAGITKKALALFVKGCYNSLKYTKLGTHLKLIAVVHDEIVLEAPEGIAEEAAEYLADCMDQACKAVLKRVYVPRTEVVLSDHWTH